MHKFDDESEEEDEEMYDYTTLNSNSYDFRPYQSADENNPRGIQRDFNYDQSIERKSESDVSFQENYLRAKNVR